LEGVIDTRTFLGVLIHVLDRGIGGGGWVVSEAFLGVGLNQMTLSHKGLKTPKNASLGNFKQR